MTESSGLPPEQEAVRRLLADARHDGPPPPEVVARLDDTLAHLVAERSVEPTVEPADAHDDRTPGRVVDIGSRRRRVAGIGLLAAASVVVAGVALGQVLPRGGGGADDSSAGSSSESSLAEAPTSEDDGGAEGGDSAGAAEDPGAMSSEMAPDAKRPFTDAPRLSSADDDLLDQQLLALRPMASAHSRVPGPGEAALPDDCRMAGIGPGRRAYTTLDDVSVVVVYAPPIGDAQRVAVFQCGVDDPPVHETVLPAP
jgi:hypothetical protein